MPTYASTLRVLIQKANYIGVILQLQHSSELFHLCEEKEIYTLLHLKCFRLFDKNYDGYIDKREFRWMTTSHLFSKKKIDVIFAVNPICILQYQ